MAKRRTANLWRVSVGLVMVGVGFFGAVRFIGKCDICEAATIMLIGVVPGKCSITVVPNAQASNLPIYAPGAQRVVIGTVLQNCTGARSYTLSVTSTNCPATPTGGKVVVPVWGDYLRYSVEFVNPTTGGSQADVIGLMASSCGSQIGRVVTKGHITNETSTVYTNFTGDTTLTAGTYEDVVLISLTMQ